MISLKIIIRKKSKKTRENGKGILKYSLIAPNSITIDENGVCGSEIIVTVEISCNYIKILSKIPQSNKVEIDIKDYKKIMEMKNGKI